MKTYSRNLITIVSLLSTSVAWADAQKTAPARTPNPAASQAANVQVEKILSGWPNRPKLGARQMIGKYGPPQEVTSEKLVWNNQGRYRRIMVTKEEIPHDFPKPHMDFMEHTIDYMVPVDKTDELIAFDGSSTINRTAGELSARCDLEGHNILTLNLDHDIVTGKKNVAQARKAFGEFVVQDVMGKHPPYVEALQFEASGKPVRFADVPVIPGSPKRAMKDVAGGDDAEVLAFVIAIDDNEILAAAEAGKKGVSPKVLEYAKMVHQEHGKNLVETAALGTKIRVTPMDTEAVDKVRVKGAGQLAALLPLEGEQFSNAYLKAMIAGHVEALEMIDGHLLKTAKNEALKKHLATTRGHIAGHLERAKELQGTATASRSVH